MDFGPTVQINSIVPGRNISYPFLRPTLCSRCNRAIGAEVINIHRYGTEDKSNRVSIVFQCNHCFMPFICIYDEIVDKTKDGRGVAVEKYRYELINVGPIGIEEHTFSEEIKELSSQFVDIYNQAYAAEQYKLTEVCGMAYRKALEFLLKTFLIKRYPEEEKTIAEMPLGQCINKYIDYDRIQTTAERCVWLANNHAHYLNHHVNNDLGDLKKLLRIVINYVENELIMDSAATIPHKDPS